MGNKQLDEFNTHSVYGHSSVQEFVIPNTENGSNVNPIRIKNYIFAYLTISCENVAGITGLSLNLMVSEVSGGVLKPLYGMDKQKWEFTVSETFFLPVFVAGIVDIQIRLIGGNASADTTFKIRMIDTGGIADD